MLVYRTEEQVVPAEQAWAALSRQIDALGAAPRHDAIVSMLVEAGEFEAAVADCLFPVSDGIDILAQALRRVSVAAARVLLESWNGDRDGAIAETERLRAALREVPAPGFPPHIALRPCEGYAFYGLHPESYAAAAESYFETVRPAAVVCIGIRGIGTSLSAMIAAQAERDGIRAACYSVRPRGHPFDRRVTFDSALAGVLRDQPEGTEFLIADEGPGLSGSSFASTARALIDAGIAEGAIVFFPSWDSDGSAFKSASARETWRRHRRYVADESVGAAYMRGSLGSPSCTVDLSAGAWRRHWCGAETTWPAVHPQHERRKLWAPAGGKVARFAGLGRYGAARLRRAEKLASAGLWSGQPALQDGYLRLQYVEGSPCRALDGRDWDLVEQMARYLSFVSREFQEDARTPLEQVEEMVRTNVRLAAGEDAARTAETVLGNGRHAVADAPAVALDGRMLPHEWIRTTDGFLKADGLDHHADHFFPGVQDPVWDLAAASIEFNLGTDAVRVLTGVYARTTGDRDVMARLPWHRLAYLAFRTGYVRLAADSLGDSADGLRFTALVPRYVAALRRELSPTPSVP